VARWLVATICLAAVAAGCNTRGPEAGKTILAYTRWGDPSEMESTRELIAQFEKGNPDVAVRVDVVSWEQYWQKMKTAVVTGTAQDVWLISPAYIEEYASAGHLLDLTPYIENDPTFDINDYFPRSFDDFSFTGEGEKMRPVPFGQGRIFAFTRDYNCRLLYYNRDHFDALGLAYPDETWTWDDLVTAAKKLTIDFDGDGHPDQWGYAGLDYLAFAHTIGGEELDVERVRSTYDTPLVVKAIRFLQDLIYKHKVHPPPTLQINTQTNFITGKISMMVSGVWNVRRYNDSDSLWDIAPIPVDVKGRVHHMADGGVAHGIYARSRHKDAAWKLVKFLSDEVSQRALARSGTSVPVLKTAAESEDFLAPFDRPPKKSYHVIFDNLRAPRSPRRAPRGNLQYNWHIRNILDAVWRNNRTPEEACRMIDEKTNAVLTEHYPEATP